MIHSAVAADADRVLEFAERAERLSRVVFSHSDNETRAEHVALWGRINDWHRETIREIRADLVPVGPEQRADITSAFTEMLPYAKLYDAELADAGDVSVLRRLREGPPSSMPDYHLNKLIRSTARFRRLVELEGPDAVLATETKIAANLLDWSAPFEPHPIRFDSDEGFRNTFAFGIEACVLRRRDLGIGDRIMAVLGLEPGDHLFDEYDRWLGAGAVEPLSWHVHSLLPNRTFGATMTFRSYFEGTTPIHWAAGEDLHRLADAASSVESWAAALSTLATQANAVISWVQLMPPEAEGHGLFLVDD